MSLRRHLKADPLPITFREGDGAERLALLVFKAAQSAVHRCCKKPFAATASSSSQEAVLHKGRPQAEAQEAKLLAELGEKAKLRSCPFASLTAAWRFAPQEEASEILNTGVDILEAQSVQDDRPLGAHVAWLWPQALVAGTTA